MRFACINRTVVEQNLAWAGLVIVKCIWHVSWQQRVLISVLNGFRTLQQFRVWGDLLVSVCKPLPQQCSCHQCTVLHLTWNSHWIPKHDSTNNNTIFAQLPQAVPVLTELLDFLVQVCQILCYSWAFLVVDVKGCAFTVFQGIQTSCFV